MPLDIKIHYKTDQSCTVSELNQKQNLNRNLYNFDLSCTVCYTCGELNPHFSLNIFKFNLDHHYHTTVSHRIASFTDKSKEINRVVKIMPYLISLLQMQIELEK